MNRNTYTEHDIQNLLRSLGIPVNKLGFLYLTHGMMLVFEDYEYAIRVSKMLYVDIASKYRTEPQAVERCIRHSILVAYDRIHNDFINEIFSAESYPKTPTPTEFITGLYFYMINKADAAILHEISPNEKEA